MNTKPFSEDSGRFPVLIDMERPEEAGDFFDAAHRAAPELPEVSGPYHVYMRRAAAHYLRTMLGRYGSVRAAAKAVSLNRTHMHNLMRKLGVQTPSPAHQGNWDAPIPGESDGKTL